MIALCVDIECHSSPCTVVTASEVSGVLARCEISQVSAVQCIAWFENFNETCSRDVEAQKMLNIVRHTDGLQAVIPKEAKSLLEAKSPPKTRNVATSDEIQNAAQDLEMES